MKATPKTHTEIEWEIEPGEFIMLGGLKIENISEDHYTLSKTACGHLEFGIYIDKFGCDKSEHNNA